MSILLNEVVPLRMITAEPCQDMMPGSSVTCQAPSEFVIIGRGRGLFVCGHHCELLTGGHGWLTIATVRTYR